MSTQEVRTERMMETDFEVGDLVWAKMKNYPPWPGQIADPPENAKVKKGRHYIFFFGTEDYAWMKREAINHHASHMIPPPSKKFPALKLAINKIIKLSKERSFKEDTILESTDGALFENLPETFSSKDGNLKDNEKSPKSEVSPCEDIGQSPSNGERLCDSNLDAGESDSVKTQEDNKNSPDSTIGEKRLSSNESKCPKIRKFNGGNCSKDNGERLCDSNLDAGESDSVKTQTRKYIPPTSKKIGFLGLGNMGQVIAKALLISGHNVTVWNRTRAKCRDLIQAGALSCENPAEVVKTTDIIFSCVADSTAVKDLIFQPDGVLKGFEESILAEGSAGADKGYVEMSSIDSETSVAISEAIESRGGRYLKASLVGSRAHVEQGNIMLIASGNEKLFDECYSCIQALSLVYCYLGSDVAASSKISVILSSFIGTTFAALAETLALAQCIDVPMQSLLEIFELFLCPDFINKARALFRRESIPRNNTLKHQQKDLAFALNLSNDVTRPVPVMAAANELYKRAMVIGLKDDDIAAVFKSVT